MRSFNEVDKTKKKRRIQTVENPASLSREALAQLEDAIKASLREGYLPCAIAFKIASEAGVPKIAVGDMTDRLGVRVANCQIGCFKVDKTIHDKPAGEEADKRIVNALASLKEKDELTCANVHSLARQLNLTPMSVADVANTRNWKIHVCQLGCF
ncbi:MAG: hypothetical protein A2Z29_10610 [Chloroflexi bacterium RBG_16_56_11]|nr:MAG: hypothetical protein A2Z29_10610 [Chloroflexi bacterium RBG_16_56_11]